jgi:hypothetical protein
LAEQIVIANNQAAVLMEKGGNALLVGENFVAIEAFNNVLKLPPNAYSQDAQLWIGISREKLGQSGKAVLEYQTYMKLYPDGHLAAWVKDRLDKLKVSQPSLFLPPTKPGAAPVLLHNTEFQYSEFGSISMYYYQGFSQTNISPTPGAVQSPQTISNTYQKSLMTNVNMMARSYNNEYDNRLVFQDFFAANFLHGQASKQRLGAAYYEMKDRIVNYSVKIGRQSGLGGGVMGRFDGISAGYGFGTGMRANVVTGQLSDYSIDAKPTFNGISLDFGTKSPMGGSVYFINQNVSGITDRRAVGGNLRYFEQRFNVMGMLDYDVQIKALNMVMLQGTVNGIGNGATDLNFLLDHRRSPILDIRNAALFSTTPIAALIQDRTKDELIQLAKQRTQTSNMAQIGMTNHLNEKWNIGTDFTISNTSALPRSGGNTSLPCSDVDNQAVIPLEGCVDAQPSSGNAWTISERMTGLGVIQPRDITNFSLSYSKNRLSAYNVFQVSNHVDLREKWTLDTTLLLNMQHDNTGGKSYDISPTARAAYMLRNNLSVDGQFGIDWNKNSNSASQTSTTSWREFFSFGGRYNF